MIDVFVRYAVSKASRIVKKYQQMTVQKYVLNEHLLQELLRDLHRDMAFYLNNYPI
jgi:hypothetical protein